LCSGLAIGEKLRVKLIECLIGNSIGMIKNEIGSPNGIAIELSPMLYLQFKAITVAKV